MSVAILFPGQGGLKPGLGQPWVDHPAWKVVAWAEEVTGRDLGRLLLDAEASELSRTGNAQLATLLLSLVAWEAVGPTLDATPDCMAGHSLGQITSLVVAGAVDREAGLRLAVERAAATQAAADSTPGQLAALMGATAEQAESLAADTPECWLANDNGAGQVVIGGTPAGIAAATANAKDHGIRKVIPLDVGGAFHTPLMQEAVERLRPTLEQTTFLDTAIPVISNGDAQPYTAAAGWDERLARHLVEPVRWASTMATIADRGVTQLIEIGSTGMLAGLAKRGLPGVPVRVITTPEDIEVSE